VSSTITVAYLLSTFPQLTQTFVTREIFWIRSHDVRVEIFSLFKPESIPAEAQARELMSRVHYSPPLSANVVAALIHFLVRSPLRLLRALGRTIVHGYREPKLLLQALSIFPKSVYFARQMKKLEIEHIHAHFVTLAAFAAGTAAELLGVTFTVHGHAVDLFSRDARDVRRQLENASGVVTISSFHRAFISGLCPAVDQENLQVVYCGLETDRFQPASGQTDSGGPLRILSIGRLIEKKGFEYLIDACKILADAGYSFQCQIVGDGPLQDALQERIDRHGLQERVHLLGALQQDRVLALYGQSDMFALACVVADDGNRDGLPVVLIEAMSCELPVVTTPVTGIVDLVEHNRTGILVKERDAAALADTLKLLIERRDLRESMGRLGRQKILSDFQVQQTTARLASFFRKVAGRRGA